MSLPNFLTSRTLESGSQLLLEQLIVLAREILLGLLLHQLHPLIPLVVEYQWLAMLIFYRRVQWFVAWMQLVDLPHPQTRWYGSVYALVSVFWVPELCLCLSEFCYWQDALDNFVDFDENVDSFLSNDDGDGRDMFAAFEKRSSEHNTESLKG